MVSGVMIGHLLPQMGCLRMNIPGRGMEDFSTMLDNAGQCWTMLDNAGHRLSLHLQRWVLCHAKH